MIKLQVFIEKIYSGLLKLIFLLVVFLLGMGFKGVVSSFALTYFLLFLFTAIKLKNLDLIRMQRCPLQKDIKSDLARFSAPLFFEDLINFILNYGVIFILGYFLASADIGIYNIAFKLSFSFIFIQVAFNQIFAPIVGELFHKGDKQVLKFAFRFSSEWVFKLCLPILVIFIFFGKNILSIFGHTFLSGYSVLVILSLAQILFAHSGFCAAILTMTGHPKLSLLNTAIAAVINICLNYLLVPKLGIIGSALAFILSMIFMYIARLVEVYLIFKIHSFSFNYFKAIIFSIASIAVTVFLLNVFNLYNRNFGFIFGILTFVLIYALSVFFSDKDDLRILFRRN